MLIPILDNIDKNTNVEIINNFSWTICNLVRGNPKP